MWIIIVVVLVMASGTESSAQSADVTPLPAVFVGAGWGPATTDASSRMRLYNDEVAYVWLVEAGAARPGASASLPRGEHVGQYPRFLPWQVEFRSSRRST